MVPLWPVDNSKYRSNLSFKLIRLDNVIYDFKEFVLETRGLIYKMLCRNHLKKIRTNISQIVRVIHKINIRTESARTHLFQM